MEVSNKNHGGHRQGAGRPKAEPTIRVRIPVSLEKPFHVWLKEAVADENQRVQRLRTSPGKASADEGVLEETGKGEKGARRA